MTPVVSGVGPTTATSPFPMEFLFSYACRCATFTDLNSAPIGLNHNDALINPTDDVSCSAFHQANSSSSSISWHSSQSVLDNVNSIFVNESDSKGNSNGKRRCWNHLHLNLICQNDHCRCCCSDFCLNDIQANGEWEFSKMAKYYSDKSLNSCVPRKIDKMTIH